MEQYKTLFKLNGLAFKNALKKIDPEKLDYETLLKFSESTISNESERATNLLLSYFSKQLKPKTLIGFLKSGESFVVEKASELLQRIDSKEFSYKTIFHCFTAEDSITNKVLKGLLEKLDPAVLTESELSSYLQSDSTRAKEIAKGLLQEVDPAKFDYQKLLALKEKGQLAIQMRIILDKLNPNKEALLGFVKSQNQYMRQNVIHTLLEHYPESVGYMELLSVLKFISQNERKSNDDISREKQVKKLLEKVDPELVDYKEIIDFLDTFLGYRREKSAVDEAMRLLEKLGQKHLDYETLLEYSTRFRFSALKAVCTLLLKHFPEKLEYKTLLRISIFRNCFSGARILLRKTKKSDVDFDFLSKSIHDGQVDSEKQVLLSELLMTHFPERLHVDTLLDFLYTDDTDVKNQTKKLLEKVDLEVVECEPLFKRLKSMGFVYEYHNSTAGGIKKLLLKVSPEKLDYKIILDYLDLIDNDSLLKKLLEKVEPETLDYHFLLNYLNNKEGSVLKATRKLLVDNFPENLEYEVLLSFLDSRYLYVFDVAKKILIRRFSEKLDYQVLIRFLFSRFPEVRSKAQELLEKVAPETLDYEVLLNQLDEQDPLSKNEVSALLEKLDSTTFDYQVLIRFYGSRHAETRNLIREMIYSLDAKKFDSEVILNFFQSENQHVSEIAEEILSENFPKLCSEKSDLVSSLFK